MKSFHLPLALVMSLTWSTCLPAAPPAAAAADSGETATMSGNSHLRLFRPFSGNPILVVYYPWRVHADPSVEVQWLPEGEPEPLNVRPLTFVDAFLKGEFAVDVERCRLAAEAIPTSKSLSKAGIEFEINAKRNSLNVPAVWVDCRLPKPGQKGDDKTDQKSASEAKHRTELRTAFCLLENWAMDGRTLYLDLPPNHYGRPGKLRFWMLRGKDTLWMETVAWPGLPGGTVDDSAPAAGAAAKPGGAKGSPNGKGGGGAKPGPNGKAAPAAKPAKGTANGQEKAAEDDPFAEPKETKKK